MKQLQEQANDIGQSHESKEKSSAPISSPKKKKSESAKGTTSQLKNGSPTSPKMTNLSESAQDNGTQTTRQRKPRSLMPVPKLPAKEKRAELALKKLKVKPELLATAPQITPLLKKDLKGGLKTALNAMRLATDDQEINSFLRVYDKIPVGDRTRVPWEAVAISAKVNPKHLLGAIRLAVETYCLNRSRFIAITNHPNITQARVNFGLEHVGAEKDRMALDIQVGTMQGPKGPTFIGTQQVAVFGNRGGKAVAKGDDDEGKTVEAQYDSSDGFDDLFPSPNDVQEKLVPIRQRLLEG